MSNLFYPTVLGKVQCPECENAQINPISIINSDEFFYKTALLENNINVLFHCPSCGFIFVDYFCLSIEKKRKKLFSLINELDNAELSKSME